MAELHLNYLVLLPGGRHILDRASLTMSSDVIALREKIYDEHRIKFEKGSIDRSDLTLHKVSRPDT